MAHKLIYIPNDATQNSLFCRLQLVVETSGQLTIRAKQTKFNKSPQSYQANE